MYYKFDYGSKVKKFISILLELITTLSLLFFIEFVLFLLIIYVDQFFTNESFIVQVLFAIYLLVSILILIKFALIIFSKKGAFIKDNCLVIKKRYIDAFPIGFSYEIDINAILSCEKIYYKKPLFDDGKNYGTFLFNAENVVKIKTERYTFYPSIVNADSFVREIKKRQERAND